VGYKHNKKEMIMSSTNFSVGSSGMIMRSGGDTGYSVSGSSILKGGSSTDMSVNNNGNILKGGSFTGYTVGSGGAIMKESDNGYSIDWMFN
jgi:hypothetical protein